MQGLKVRFGFTWEISGSRVFRFHVKILLVWGAHGPKHIPHTIASHPTSQIRPSDPLSRYPRHVFPLSDYQWDNTSIKEVAFSSEYVAYTQHTEFVSCEWRSQYVPHLPIRQIMPIISKMVQTRRRIRLRREKTAVDSIYRVWGINGIVHSCPWRV